MIQAPVGGPPASSRRSPALGARRFGAQVFGGVLGGLVGGAFVVGAISALKAMLAYFATKPSWLLILLPVVGLALASLVLNGLGRAGEARGAHAWRTFPPDMVRADITADVADNAGHEENFPWWLAPIRLAAIFATVGFGASMGTEAPAAYLGQAVGAWLGDRDARWRQLIRPAALGGGAAGVAALMGIPLVGTAYVLEIGKRHGAPYSLDRVIPAAIGGLVGGGLNSLLGLRLIRLVEPQEPPLTFLQAVVTALFIGALSGSITAFCAFAVYRAKKWTAPPLIRLAFGGLAAIAAAMSLSVLADPAASFGPGGAAISWAERSENAAPWNLFLVAVLQAAGTAAAAAAGGCGGVFVPFMAIGDLAGRVFAPGFRVGADLAGAAGAAGGIAGGYRLPLTAAAMVLGLDGPIPARLTCFAVVIVAYYIGKTKPFHGDLTGIRFKRAPAA